METIARARQCSNNDDDKAYSSVVEWNEVVEIDEKKQSSTDGAEAPPQKQANDAEGRKDDNAEQKHSHTENSDREERMRRDLKELQEAFEDHLKNDDTDKLLQIVPDATQVRQGFRERRRNAIVPQETVVAGRKKVYCERKLHRTNGCETKEDGRKDIGENEYPSDEEDNTDDDDDDDEQKKTDAAIFQQAWDLVEGAIAMQTDDIKIIARDDIIYLAERMLKTQEDFRRRNIPYGVDVAYHHTKSENLRTIRTNGLLSRNERDRQQIVAARYNGSKHGDGIYCSIDPVAHAHRYGDVTIVLARMKGNESNDSLLVPKNEIINTVVVPERNLCVLRSSNQCVPLFCFDSNILPRAGSGSHPSKIADFHKQVQHHLIDKMLTWNGRTVLDPMEFPGRGYRRAANNRVNLPGNNSSSAANGNSYPSLSSAANGNPYPSQMLPKCVCNWRFCRTYQKAWREFQHPTYNGVIKMKFYENDPRSMALKASIDRTLNVSRGRSNDWKEVESNNVPGCTPVTSTTKMCRYYVARHHFTEEMIKHYLKNRSSWDWNEPMLVGEARQYLHNLDPQDMYDDGAGNGFRRYVKNPNVPKECVRRVAKTLKDEVTKTRVIDPLSSRVIYPLSSEKNNNHNSTASPTGATSTALQEQKKEENHKLREGIDNCKNKINTLQNTVEQLKARLDLDDTADDNARHRRSVGKGTNTAKPKTRNNVSDNDDLYLAYSKLPSTEADSLFVLDGRSRRSAGKRKNTAKPKTRKKASDKDDEYPSTIKIQEQEAAESSFELDNLDGVSNKNTCKDTIYVKGKQIVDWYGGWGVYTGALSRSSCMPKGVGRIEYDNRWYEGDWDHGRWTGFGKFLNEHGDSYEGGLENAKKHGTGIMRFADGRVFEGEYIRGEMVQGKITYQDGSTYDGSWRNGMRHGKGKCIFADGSQYEGEFREGKFHGDGKMTWNDGGRSKGNWCNGEKKVEFDSRKVKACMDSIRSSIETIKSREEKERSLAKMPATLGETEFFGGMQFPQFHVDLTDKLDEKRCYALNEDRRFPWQNLLSDETWRGCKSEDDSQIILHFEFSEYVKIKGMKITEFDNGSLSEQNPSKILCFQNRSNLGFEDIESVDPTTTLTLTGDDLKDKSKVLMMKDFKHRLTKSVTLFVEENNGGCITSLGRLQFYGDCIKT